MVTSSLALALVLASGCGATSALDQQAASAEGAVKSPGSRIGDDPLDVLGPSRSPVPLPPPSYPLWNPEPAAPGKVGSCVPALEVTLRQDHLIVNSSMETSRPVVDRGWALLYDGTACSLLGASPSGEPERIPVIESASRIQADGDDVLVADGYSMTRVVERIRGSERVGTWQTRVPEHFYMDSFYFSPELVGFADLVLNSTDLGASDHVFWIADSAGAPLGRVDPGGYVAVRGRPFCSTGRCVTVGELRYVGDHAEHAWMLGARGQAEDQTLSTGPVYSAMTVEAGGALYDFFMEGDSLFVARWAGDRWEGIGRLDGVVGFQATADGADPLLAWVQVGQTWRFTKMSGGALGAVQELAGTSADDQVLLQPTSNGLALAVVRREERHEYGPFPKDLRIVRHLSARLGWMDRQGIVALSIPLEMEGEDSPNDMVVAPLVIGGRAAWMLQTPTNPTRLVQVDPCPGGR